jgi:ABC-2 type transport system ATP-binding protein
VTKRFSGRVAVEGVDLRVPRGSAFGYLGPNGTGTRTLIRMLLGLTEAGSGTVRIVDLPGSRAAQRCAGARCAIVEEPRFHPS